MLCLLDFDENPPKMSKIEEYENLPYNTSKHFIHKIEESKYLIKILENELILHYDIDNQYKNFSKCHLKLGQKIINFKGITNEKYLILNEDRLTIAKFDQNQGKFSILSEFEFDLKKKVVVSDFEVCSESKYIVVNLKSKETKIEKEKLKGLLLLEHTSKMDIHEISLVSQINFEEVKLNNLEKIIFYNYVNSFGHIIFFGFNRNNEVFLFLHDIQKKVFEELKEKRLKIKDLQIADIIVVKSKIYGLLNNGNILEFNLSLE